MGLSFHEIEQAEKYVGGDWENVRGLLGGKGANLAEMARIGLPVPPGLQPPLRHAMNTR